MIKRFGVFLFTMMLSRLVMAQEAWGGGVDEEILHFGFTVQNVNTDLIVQKSIMWNEVPATGEALRSISSTYRPGIGLGGLANLKLNNHFDVRFTPTLQFIDRQVFFEYQNTVVTKKIDGANLDFPLSLKIKSNRRKNFRAYAIAGPKYSMSLISEKKLNDENLSDDEKLLKIKKGFLSYEAGIGFDLYFENFKISPEVKFSQSVDDVLRRDSNRYRNAIDKLFLRSIQLSIYLE